SILSAWNGQFKIYSNRLPNLDVEPVFVWRELAYCPLRFSGTAFCWRSEASFNSRESFSTRCRMILPALNFTVARGGMTKLLPGSFGFRPTRGLVRRGWNTPKLRNSTVTLLARLLVM